VTALVRTALALTILAPMASVVMVGLLIVLGRRRPTESTVARVVGAGLVGSVLAAFVVLSCTLAIWPARKNLGTLLSCSAALMIATQFWHGYGGGLYMGWFLPLTLLTMFRPNLEDRVALSVLGESWLVRRRPRLAA